MKNAGYYRKMRLFTYAVGALVVAVMSTACGKKDEGGGQVVVTPPGVNTSCVNCPKATALLASATGRSYNFNNVVNGELSLQFYGDSTALAGMQQGSATSNWYRGSVVAGGVFRNREVRTLNGGSWYGSSGCNLPVGDYALQTTSPGQWNGQIFSSMDLVSTSGPVAITIRMSRNSIWAAAPAIVDFAGAQFPYRLVADVQISSMAGGTCVYYIGF
jgi:hypothetical protein